MNKPDLSALLARVEAAEGADRELDTAIAIALRLGAEGYPKFSLGSFRPGYVQADMGRDGWSVGWHVPVLSASLDAALALCERVLPDVSWDLSFTRGDDPVYGATFLHPKRMFQASAKTAALALLAAILKALIAQAAT